MGYSAYLYNKARAPSTPSQNSGVRPEIPLAGSPRASGTLVIPAGGKSDLIPPLEGKYPEFTGFGKFLTHNVRLDGTECAFGEAGCVNGPRLKGYYISNESGATITVTFEFKPG
ncbi:TPA: hypothetical protein DIV48_02590 [Candidatus Kaiserbacteria bacterium]|nr:hypothetical protein [Candidatus Kaiserbacteria bacterium]